ncbi:LysR family transcriptional regulator [Oricola indica]|uniref:LysR family transcriptional regulator n=1 Tax=Oricola indica TaxID=2872591 RepID=UPI003CCBAD37
MALPVRLFSGQVSDFDLKLIRTFRAVAECGGYALAEIELGTTKSAISKQIADLELRLGVTLCHRGRSGFALTDEGQFVYDKSTGLLSALEGFRSDLNALQKTPSGVLHIGCIDSIITSQCSPLIGALSRFAEDYPDVEIRMLNASAAEIDQGVSVKRLHIGVSTNRGKIRGTQSLPLFTEHGHLYCGSSHPLFDVADTEISLKQLSSQRFAQHVYSEAELRDDEKIGLTPSAIGHFTENIAALILTGGFIGFLPDHYARSWVDAGQMRPLLGDRIKKTTDIRILYHMETAGTPLVSAFLEAVRDSSFEKDVMSS